MKLLREQIRKEIKRISEEGMRSFPTRRVNESRQPRNNGCQEVIAQNKGMIQEHRALSKELKEVKKAFTTVKGELNEVNLLNSKSVNILFDIKFKLIFLLSKGFKTPIKEPGVFGVCINMDVLSFPVESI